MTLEEELKKRASEHGLTLFKVTPVIAPAYLVVDSKNRSATKPMSLETLEKYLDEKDKQADLEKEPF